MKSMIRREEETRIGGALLGMTELEIEKLHGVLSRISWKEPQVIRLVKHLGACKTRFTNPKENDKGWVNTDD